jgi:DNA-binding CsgD family transcriptional regulator
MAGGVGAVLLPLEPEHRIRGMACSASLMRALREYVDDGWYLDDYRQAGVPHLLEHGSVLDTDFYTSREIKSLPYYSSFLTSHGLGGFCGLLLDLGGSKWCASIQLHSGMWEPVPGFMAQIDAIRAELEQAARASLAASLEAFDGFARQLEDIGMFPVPVDVIGQALEMREPAEKLLREASLTWEAQDVPCDELKIPELFWQSGTLPPHPIRAHFEDAEGKAATLVQSYVNAPAESWHFAFPVYAVALLTRHLGPSVDKSNFNIRFSLTSREGSIVEGLCAGLKISEIAEKNGVSEATVRQQLKSIYRKTDTGSQHQLVSEVFRSMR